MEAHQSKVNPSVGYLRQCLSEMLLNHKFVYEEVCSILLKFTHVL